MSKRDETSDAHTPGPWRIAEGGNLGNSVEGDSGKRHYDGDDGYRTVAMYQSCCSSERWADQEANARANAHLIAAAPDMLEALRAIDANSASGSSVGRIARAAIAKARGR